MLTPLQSHRGPLAASVQLEVPDIAGIHLLRPAQPATRSVKTSIAGWKECLPRFPTGDWTSFRLTRVELRKRRFFAFQHAFLLMRLSNAEYARLRSSLSRVLIGCRMSVDLLVQRNLRGDIEHSGTGLPEDTLSILSPDHLQSFGSSTLVKAISWGGSASPSFADIIIILNTVIRSFPWYTTGVFNGYHFCAVTYNVLSIFLPNIVPVRIHEKSKGGTIFWKRVVLDSVISRDCGLVMEKISKLTRKMDSQKVDVVMVDG